jgi:hypothetical protein
MEVYFETNIYELNGNALGWANTQLLVLTGTPEVDGWSSSFHWNRHFGYLISKYSYIQWIGLRENLQESPIFNGKIYGFL